MKAKTLCAVAMLAALPLVHSNARAENDRLDWMTNAQGCHVLLTEAECARHRDALASLPNVAARHAYLAEHGIALLEREAMCSCKRNPPSAATAPARRVQLARR